MKIGIKNFHGGYVIVDLSKASKIYVARENGTAGIWLYSGFSEQGTFLPLEGFEWEFFFDKHDPEETAVVEEFREAIGLATEPPEMPEQGELELQKPIRKRRPHKRVVRPESYYDNLYEIYGKSGQKNLKAFARAVGVPAETLRAKFLNRSNANERS